MRNLSRIYVVFGNPEKRDYVRLWTFDRERAYKLAEENELKVCEYNYVDPISHTLETRQNDKTTA
jgi:hypothetical protein